MGKDLSRNRVDKIILTDEVFGTDKRELIVSDNVSKQPLMPKTLEYKDIDEYMVKFLEEDLSLSYNGKKIPTMKLFSNQKFSELKQNWDYTDEDNNPLMNFKTISREITPMLGTISGKSSIPTTEKYTLLIREVLDKNGTEHYEVHTCNEPFAVDLNYNINFITNDFELINEFNMKLLKLFKTKNYYIKPNGYNIPLTLTSVKDATSYNIDTRKVFVHGCTILAKSFIINNEDYEIKNIPKTINLNVDMDNYKLNYKKKRFKVEIEDYDDNKDSEIITTFNEGITLASFNSDFEINVKNIKTKNVRNYKIFVNNIPYFISKNIKINKGDEIKIKINPMNENLKSEIILTSEITD